MFIIKLSVSTCFGHHYAHHQENKTVSYCMWCSAWVCRLWSFGAASCTVKVTAHDGHNDARNILRQSLIINIELFASCWFSLFTLLSFKFDMIHLWCSARLSFLSYFHYCTDPVTLLNGNWLEDVYIVQRWLSWKIVCSPTHCVTWGVFNDYIMDNYMFRPVLAIFRLS